MDADSDNMDDDTTEEVGCPFDTVPGEVIVEVLVALGKANLGALAKWAATCRRHAALAMDPLVWRRLYEMRFGPPVHRQFKSEGKDWHWLYRARACVVAAATTTTDQEERQARVGTVKMIRQDSEWTYWGDLMGAVPDGYGLALYDIPKEDLKVWVDGRLVAADAGDQYEGYWKDGQRHGHGIATIRVGDTYDGNWEADTHHGHGVYTWSDGSIYVGQWQGGDRHGPGTAYYADGDWYEGDWVGGYRHGYGSYVHAVGTRYDGQWEGGLPHGYGEETSLGGMTYYGLYRCGKRCGYGIVVQDDITIYQGHWANDKIAGYGVARYADGATWRGWSVDGVKCGYGIYRWPDGTEYEGLFDADQPCDSGVYVAFGGERTVVSTNDLGTLHAVITRADGFTYTGGWLMALGSSGHGTCTYADGSCIVGTWHGSISLDGKITAHRMRGTPCSRDAPCEACAVVARGRGMDVETTRE
ncbi:Morn repeat domain containing protein [Pandoravirus macleodensis]|uniref:Morn repeat domain containing protein n=1 Tax=Pandoravirus macleodensis TaxID=2107707 RepID=A0A2U7UG37_9VIRU|nr:Morn repeat domain containing protein [Pandoravirus macleodensis]AVK77434.1 Morn repeat domain containing protein [Pandoravirus macleodensis]